MTTDAEHDKPVAPDLLQQDFSLTSYLLFEKGYTVLTCDLIRRGFPQGFTLVIKSLVSDNKLQKKGVQLRSVDTLLISPSDDVGEMAQAYLSSLPRPIRILLKGIGAMKKDGSSLTSYLLFEKGYTRALMDLGYKDAKNQTEKIENFLTKK